MCRHCYNYLIYLINPHNKYKKILVLLLTTGNCGTEKLNTVSKVMHNEVVGTGFESKPVTSRVHDLSTGLGSPFFPQGHPEDLTSSTSQQSLRWRIAWWASEGRTCSLEKLGEANITFAQLLGFPRIPRDSGHTKLLLLMGWQTMSALEWGR